MARIILGSYMVRYPLGGNLSWALQYLLGLKELGHDVFFVEKYAYPNSCYDPSRQIMSDDCTYGLKVVSELLARFGLEDKWCFVERGEIYHGLSKQAIKEVFRTADVYIDSGAHGSWTEESAGAALQVFIDGDPAYTHFKMANQALAGIPVPVYDRYFTNGKNVGKEGNSIPTLGINWGHMYSPVKTAFFNRTPAAKNAPYSTVMNWRSYAPIRYNGVTYGHKDVEFQKFLPLPKMVSLPMEVAVSGSNVPKELLLANGWSMKDAQKVTVSYDSFCSYLSACRGEFSVCKHVYTVTETGWFSDKSSAYLASGRPVILQDTGFSNHLPVGEGLFAVNNVHDAQEAILEIESKYDWHSQKAWEIACEYLEAKIVMKKFLDEIGI